MEVPPDIGEVADAASELDRLFDELGLVDPGADAVLDDDPDALVLERLPHNSCRFPSGSTAFGRTVFCGVRAEVGRPFCPEHHALSFVKPTREAKRALLRGIR